MRKEEIALKSTALHAIRKKKKHSGVQTVKIRIAKRNSQVQNIGSK